MSTIEPQRLAQADGAYMTDVLASIRLIDQYIALLFNKLRD